jgi:hypothetical protein
MGALISPDFISMTPPKRQFKVYRESTIPYHGNGKIAEPILGPKTKSNATK